MRNTADGGKPIAIWSQSFSCVSTANPLVTFNNDKHIDIDKTGRYYSKRATVFSSSLVESSCHNLSESDCRPTRVRRMPQLLTLLFWLPWLFSE
jgi:hypothetical protein